MRTVVFTCDKDIWALQIFAYLHNCYWSALQDVVVSGFRPPNFALPQNFHFMQIAPTGYPAEKWSDQVIETLSRLEDDWIVMLFVDYWLRRTVDCEAVRGLYDYVKDQPDVLRVDLTDDRQYNGHVRDIGAWGRLDLLETGWDAEYQLSTQTALINRRHWLNILRPGLSPWEYEMHHQATIHGQAKHLRVLGTRQCPVRYVNGLGMGHGDKGYTEGLPDNIVLDMRKWGWFPK